MTVETELMARAGETPEGQNPDHFDAPDIGPDEMAEHIAKMVANAFEATGLIEIVEVQAGIAQVSLMGRIKGNKEGTWLTSVVDPVLRAMVLCCDGHIGKTYILKPPDPKTGKLRYGWVIAFASNDLRDAANKITEALEPVIPRLEVTEAPLLGPGTPQSGGQGSGRRGASPVRA
jgi:hypothetical protein